MATEKDKLLLLWKNFRDGNKEAFAAIYNLHVDLLYRYGTKLCNDENLVKDAIQDVFIDLYLKSSNSIPANLKYYLLLAIKRNILKKIKRERDINNEICESLFEPEYSIETIIIEKENRDEINGRLAKILKQLSHGQKEALYLRYNETLHYDEIAQIMNITVESARKQVYRALKTIREGFRGEGLKLMELINSNIYKTNKKIIF